MTVKKRHWSFILYPESAPEDWLDILEKLCIPCAISPLHDSDRDHNGSFKKAHHHIILSYPGPTTFNNVNVLCRSLNQPIPVPVISLKGSFEYLTHKNNPDKYQYDPINIKLLSGFRCDYVVKDDSIVSNVKVILDFIEDNNIIEFDDLVSAIVQLGNDALLSCIMKKSYFFVQYLRSRYFSSLSVTQKQADDCLLSDFPIQRMED